MDLYIFRHGVTYFSENHLEYGKSIESAEILDKAKPSIEKIGNYLKNIDTDKYFTSPYKRCLQTSAIVSAISGKEFEVNTDLRDWDPEAEIVPGMIKRIERFSKYLENSAYSSVSICTHGYPINALIAYFTKGKIQEKDLPDFPDPGILVSIIAGKLSYKDLK